MNVRICGADASEPTFHFFFFSLCGAVMVSASASFFSVLAAFMTFLPHSVVSQKHRNCSKHNLNQIVMTATSVCC